MIGNTGSNSTREAVHATRQGFAVGMHAALQINPYYGKTSMTGLQRHFEVRHELRLSIQIRFSVNTVVHFYIHHEAAIALRHLARSLRMTLPKRFRLHAASAVPPAVQSSFVSSSRSWHAKGETCAEVLKVYMLAPSGSCMLAVFAKKHETTRPDHLRFSEQLFT